MQTKIGTGVEWGATVSPFDRIGASSTIDRSTWNYLNTGEKVQKIRKLILTGTYLSCLSRNAGKYRHSGTTCTHIVQRYGKFRLLNNVNQ